MKMRPLFNHCKVDMELFSVRFLALDRVPRLLPAEWVSSEKSQERLVELTLGSIPSQFPLPRVQIRNLLEAIIRTCESCSLVVIEDVYERLVELDINKESPEEVFGHYRIGDRNLVFRVHGDPHALVQDGSTGFMTWEAGKCLSWYLACVHNISGKRIMEIGCGTGITGIVTSTFQPIAEYMFTDYHASTLENASRNFEQNKYLGNCSDVAKFRQLDMLKNLDSLETDIIVGSDILYDESLARGLVSFLEQPEVVFKEALIVSTIRTETTYEIFLDALRASTKLKFESLQKQPFSEWTQLPNDNEWKFYLDSATRLFDPVVDLVRIVPV